MSTKFHWLLVIGVLVVQIMWNQVKCDQTSQTAQTTTTDLSTSEVSTLANRIHGSCSSPNIPPKAAIRFTSPAKQRWAENETIYVMCEHDQFPHHLQKRTCRHGLWQGPQARCGKSVEANVVQVTVTGCDPSNQPILSLSLNQSTDTTYPLPTNSFHFTRLRLTDPSVTVDRGRSDCFRWLLKFDRPVEVAFLLVDFNLEFDQPEKSTTETSVVSVKVAHRNCKQQHLSRQKIEFVQIFGYYFFCDLDDNTVDDDEETSKTTDHFVVEVRGSQTEQSNLGLEAVFVGKTYKSPKHQTLPDCGKPEIQSTAVLTQMVLENVFVRCNESFREIRTGIEQSNKFVCDQNGVWKGETPQCFPKVICPIEPILAEQTTESAVVIEQIGNVYYDHQDRWYAIDHTWVRYACAQPDQTMVGGSATRVCIGGQWSEPGPRNCTRPTVYKSFGDSVWDLFGLATSSSETNQESGDQE